MSFGVRIGFWGTIALAMDCLAAVEPNENLLANGTFEADQVACPPGWIVWMRDRPLVKPIATEGPNGLPCLRMKSDEPKDWDAGAHQGGIHLASNGLYRLSVRIRTKNLRCKNSGIAVISPGWKNPHHVGNIPADTDGKWIELSHEFVWTASGSAEANVFATAFTGQFDIADMRLLALNEIALAGTEPSAESAARKKPRFVPFAPLLWEIPKDRPKVSFRFFGRTPSGTCDDCDCVLKVAEGEVKVPLSTDLMTVRLPKGATEGRFTVCGVNRATGSVFGCEEFSYRVVDMPSKANVYGRRRNNLCTDLASKRLPLKDGTIDFVVPREGWVYVRVKGDAGDGVEVRMDGEVVIDKDAPRLETFRLTRGGRHVLTVHGVADGWLTIRLVADIFNYRPCGGCGVPKGATFDWEYERKHVLPAVTSENGGEIPEEVREAFVKSGRRWIGTVGTVGVGGDDLVKLLSGCSGMTGPAMAGVTCDEQYFWNLDAISSYQKGLKAFDLAHSPERVIYTWIVGKPMMHAQDQSFFATCVNASRGRGKILLESYCRPTPTEEEAWQYIRHYVGGTLDCYRQWYPIAVASSCVAFGNFVQWPILSLAHRPEVDYKYFLDMQVNFAANDASCRDLGAVGYWGTNYADDEMRRWSFALMRHYVVEGNTNLLSRTYGYSYRPEHLANGDFAGSFAPWRMSGKVWLDSHRGYGKCSQCRWGGNGEVGDTFAVLVRETNRVASVSQTVRGLKPGAKYCLQFMTCDAKDVKASRHAPRRFGVDVRLGVGARKCPELSWVYVDDRIKGRYDFNTGVARVNLHHVVFVAESREFEISFDNASALAGEELGVNAVSLNPYFEGSAGLMD